MSSIRILHASDLHISKRAGYTSGFDRISAGLTLKRIVQVITHPNKTLWEIKKTAWVSTYDPNRLRHFAKLIYDDCNAQPNHDLGTLDAVILTGDLATTGLQDDLDRVFEFLEGPADSADPTTSTSKHPTLAAINQAVVGKKDESLPVWILPGNHDRYRRVAPRPNSTLTIDYSPGGKIFESALPSYWGHPYPGQPDWGPDVIEFPTLTKDNLNVTIIAADFNLKDKHDRDGMFGKYAQGKVYEKNPFPILDQLKNATDDVMGTYNQPHVILWAIHFPPEFPKLSTTMRLIDKDKLLQAAKERGVRAILSGHTHRHLSYSTQNALQVFCAGTATQFYAPAGNFFGIIEVDVDPVGNISIQHECFRYKKLRDDFVRVQRCSDRYLRRMSKL